MSEKNLVWEGEDLDYENLNTGGPRYLRTWYLRFRLFAGQKTGKTANSEGNLINLSLECRFWYSRVHIFQERNPRKWQGKPVLCDIPRGTFWLFFKL